MAKHVLMPQVGQDLTEGVLLTWNVKPGDKVEKGDIVAVVESEKASFEVEAFDEGYVLELLYNEGDMATVLEPLLYLGEKDEEAPGDSKDRGEAGGQPMPAADATMLKNGAQAGSKRGSSPLARRLARRHGLDIAVIAGTGPRGSVVKRDIEKALAGIGNTQPSAGPAEARTQARAQREATPRPVPVAARAPATLPAEAGDREVPFDRMRQTIADRLLQSKQTIPHFYLRAEADVTDLMTRRKAFLDMGGPKTSINDVVVHATALTLLEYPRLNAHVASDRLIIKGRINLGIAVSVENGLMVPVIENAPYMSIAEISSAARDHAAAARRGMTKSTASGTFSISNLGMFGVEVMPIINPPEAGILGVGPIRRSVCEHRGGIRFRDVMALTLAADHRAVDGAYGAQFLQSLCEAIAAYSFEAQKAAAATE